MPASAPIDLRALCGMLDARAAELAPRLLPNGQLAGPHWRTGNISDDRGQSLCVDISGPTIGRWTDFSAPNGSREKGGDMLELATQVRFGGRKGDAIAWAKSVLGLDGLDPDRLRHEIARSEARVKDAAAEAEKQAAKRRGKAQALFLQSTEIIDTPAEWYLAERGIDLSLLGRHPRALRFHPQVWCAEVKAELPAMLAAIVDLDGQHLATHRTYLAETGGVWSKARLSDPKSTLGAYAGGFIPLWKGVHRQSMGALPAGTDVHVSEGIEDGLTVACARPDLRIVAAVSLANLGGIRLPETIGRFVIIGQRDEKPEAIAALDAAIARQQEAGRTVAIAMPPAGVKDANDLVQNDRARAA